MSKTERPRPAASVLMVAAGVGSVLVGVVTLTLLTGCAVSVIAGTWPARESG